MPEIPEEAKLSVGEFNSIWRKPFLRSWLRRGWAVADAAAEKTWPIAYAAGVAESYVNWQTEMKRMAALQLDTIQLLQEERAKAASLVEALKGAHDALQELWPGLIDEPENVDERAVAIGEWIAAETGTDNWATLFSEILAALDAYKEQADGN